MCTRASALLTLFLTSTSIAADPPSKLFDAWTYQATQQTAIQRGGRHGHYLPSGYPEAREYFTSAFSSSAKQGYWSALNTRCFDVAKIAPAVDWLEHQQLGLDYVFADAECDGIVGDIQKVQSYIDKIQGSGNPAIRTAKVGNWSWFDGMYTDTWWFYQPWPVWPEHRLAEEYTRTSLQVSLPCLYPYSYNIKHVTAGDHLNGSFRTYVGGSSPNQRSAQFWAPLEILSSAKRRLPHGQELIPFVSDYLHVNGFDPKPDQYLTDADFTAAIRHYRLRGADGLYTWSEKNSERYLEYRTLVAEAWKSLDEFYRHPGQLRLLNQENKFGTNKRSGVEWSGAQKGNRVVMQASNLSGASASISWVKTELPTGLSVTASILSLPPSSPSIAAGQHLLLQYRTPYFEYLTFEALSIGRSMLTAGGWQASGGSSKWIVTAPAGRGNVSGRVLTVNSSSAVPEEMHFEMGGTGTPQSTGRMIYSAMFYFNNSEVSIAPIRKVGEGGKSSAANYGPRFGVDGGANHWQFTIKTAANESDAYAALNGRPVVGHWYEVQVEMDSKDGVGGGARVFVRDVSAGDDLKLLVWMRRSVQQSDRRTLLPLPPGKADYTAWAVTAGSGTQFDNFNRGYAVPTIDDNFEHYDSTSTLDVQGWSGLNADQWVVVPPQRALGNSSAFAATPKANAKSVSAWRRMVEPGFEPRDSVVYSALLYGTGMGFAPIATAGLETRSAASATGPYIYMRSQGDAGFYIEPTNGGRRFKATTQPTADHWYEVQVVVDPSFIDASGASPTTAGVVRVFARDRTTDAKFEQLIFVDESARDKQRYLELPLHLTDANNPTTWDGWQVHGEDRYSQIDSLKAFLYPYRNSREGGAIGPSTIGPSP